MFISPYVTPLLLIHRSFGVIPSSSSSSSTTLTYAVHLTPTVVPAKIEAYFARVATVHDVHLYREYNKQTQWAKMTVATEREAEGCMSLKEDLMKDHVTISDPVKVSLPQTDVLGPRFARSSLRGLPLSYHPVPPLLPGYRSEPTLNYRQANPAAELPTNLYILNLPIELDEYTFRSIFTPFGMVEHSELLSEFDGMGRRRGFIIMGNHREASEVMMALNGEWIEGFRMDITWALKQLKPHEIKKRKGAQLANRVIHPPHAPFQIEHDDSAYCSVIIEGLDSEAFPNPTAIQDLFSHFGPVNRVTILPGYRSQVIVAFEASHTAHGLVNRGWISIGGSTIRIKPLLAVERHDSRQLTFPRRDSQATLTIDHHHTPFSTSDQHHNAIARYQPQGSGWTPNKFDWSRKIRSQLNPASQAFVPTSMTHHSHPTPLSTQDLNRPRDTTQVFGDTLASQSGSHRSHGSHTSGDHSKTSKTSSKTSNMSKNSSTSIPVSQVEDEGLKAIKEIWSRPSLWCEWSGPGRPQLNHFAETKL